MRTKTTLLCAAALAAGVVGSMAQSNVYSINIVGYSVQDPGTGPFLYANPLNLDNTNSASNVLNCAPLNDGGGGPAGSLTAFYVLTWNGSSFKSVYFESDFTANNYGAGYNGWAVDNSPSAPATPPNLPPGVGFFLVNAGLEYTNTFVGSVVPYASGTPAIALPSNESQTSTNITISLPVGPTLVGSIMPVSGPITNAGFQFPLAPVTDGGGGPAGSLTACYILTWSGSSYASKYFESDFTANNYGAGYNGWAVDNSPSAPTTPPNIALQQGFFVVNAGLAATWTVTNIVP